LKSSTGKYYQALDHIRAVAVFVVFVWHFNHFDNGQLASPLVFPLSLFTEGHTGVAIFMVLSGYLFAKLLGNKKINYPVFLYNRGLRLLPLLVCVLLIIAAQAYVDDKLNAAFFIHLLKGFVLPTLPNGGWSITVEFHFYIVLPVLLITAIKFPNLLMFSLIVFVGARVGFYILVGEVQSVSYWTIIGRIDQFLLGIIGFRLKDHITGKKYLALPIVFFFLVFWFYFDTLGGFYNPEANVTNKALWIIIPTIEGISYTFLIAWYDNRSRPSNALISRFIALVGNYSYSIYLLHFFFVFEISEFINSKIIALSNPYIVLLAAIPSFLVILPISFISFKLIETPFLRFRKSYLR
jgi:rhamnosyltransferase